MCQDASKSPEAIYDLVITRKEVLKSFKIKHVNVTLIATKK